jgi:hypothetical protein
MSKWLSILCSFVLAVVIISFIPSPVSASATSDCDVVEGTGEVQFCALSAVYEGRDLVLRGLFVNTGVRPHSQLERLKVKVTGAEGEVLSEGEWVNDPTLLGLSLNPGQTELVELPLTGALRSTDVTRLNTVAELTFREQGGLYWNSGIQLFAGGRQLLPEVPPFIQDGSTLVPLRVIFEALGMAVGWDQAAQTVTATDQERKLVLRVGERKLTLNGVTKEFEVPAQVVNGSTFIPLRAVAESLGSAVFYGKFNNSAQIVMVEKK